MCRHARVVLLELRKAMAGANGGRAQTRLDGAREDHQQSAAMDRMLRPAVAGIQAARLAPDQSAVFRVVGELPRLNGGRGERGLQTQRAERAHGMRQKIDADAELPHGRRGLVDDGVDARLMQRERRSQAADAAACDEHAHRSGPLTRHGRSLAVFGRNSDSAADPACHSFPKGAATGKQR